MFMAQLLCGCCARLTSGCGLDVLSWVGGDPPVASRGLGAVGVVAESVEALGQAVRQGGLVLVADSKSGSGGGHRMVEVGLVVGR